ETQDAFFHSKPDFSDEVAARNQEPLRRRDQPPECCKSLVISIERDFGFVLANLDLQPGGLFAAYIRRIADDEVEGPRRPVQKIQAGDRDGSAKIGGVEASDAERVQGDVCQSDLNLGQFKGNGDPDAAGAS